MNEKLLELRQTFREVPSGVWIALGAVAFGYILFLSRPTLFVVQYLNDDAFYYFQVARTSLTGMETRLIG